MSRSRLAKVQTGWMLSIATQYARARCGPCKSASGSRLPLFPIQPLVRAILMGMKRRLPPEPCLSLGRRRRLGFEGPRA